MPSGKNKDTEEEEVNHNVRMRFMLVMDLYLCCKSDFQIEQVHGAVGHDADTILAIGAE